MLTEGLYEFSQRSGIRGFGLGYFGRCGREFEAYFGAVQGKFGRSS